MADKLRCDFASQANAALGPCSADPCTCCADRTFSYRPYFILQSGVTRYGAEHLSENEAWEEVAFILVGKHPAKPEWAIEFRAIVEYGVELPARRPRRVLGAGIGR